MGRRRGKALAGRRDHRLGPLRVAAPVIAVRINGEFHFDRGGAIGLQRAIVQFVVGRTGPWKDRALRKHRKCAEILVLDLRAKRRARLLSRQRIAVDEHCWCWHMGQDTRTRNW